MELGTSIECNRILRPESRGASEGSGRKRKLGDFFISLGSRPDRAWQNPLQSAVYGGQAPFCASQSPLSRPPSMENESCCTYQVYQVFPSKSAVSSPSLAWNADLQAAQPKQPDCSHLAVPGITSVEGAFHPSHLKLAEARHEKPGKVDIGQHWGEGLILLLVSPTAWGSPARRVPGQFRGAGLPFRVQVCQGGHWGACQTTVGHACLGLGGRGCLNSGCHHPRGITTALLLVLAFPGIQLMHGLKEPHENCKDSHTELTPNRPGAHHSLIFSMM